MFVSCWSAKGGRARRWWPSRWPRCWPGRAAPGVLLVDLAGDVPAVLGLPEPTGPGLSDWLAAGAEVPADGLARLELAVTDDLHLLARGRGPLDPVERVEVLAGLLADEARSVVVDCGVPCWPRASADAGVGPGDAAAVLAGAAVESLVVTRACYLSLAPAGGGPRAAHRRRAGLRAGAGPGPPRGRGRDRRRSGGRGGRRTGGGPGRRCRSAGGPACRGALERALGRVR